MDFRGRVFLAPLTKGGNLPFRRLCLAHGGEVTMGEMAYAYQVVKRSKSELALLRKHDEETCFGAQIAASRIDDAVRAGNAAAERGAKWVDLNCGCPIHDIVKRRMGATLLRKPHKLARLVEGMVEGVPRTCGWRARPEDTIRLLVGDRRDDTRERSPPGGAGRDVRRRDPIAVPYAINYNFPNRRGRRVMARSLRGLQTKRKTKHKTRLNPIRRTRNLPANATAHRCGVERQAQGLPPPTIFGPSRGRSAPRVEPLHACRAVSTCRLALSHRS